jgi:DNA primase
VSTPLDWDEVSTGGLTGFTAPQVLQRVERHGDLFAATLDDRERAVLPARPGART